MRENKNSRLNLRCTEEFKAYVETNASELDISVTEFVERCVMSASIIHYDGLKEFIPVMRKHGNNLNQIARHLNSGYGFNKEIDQLLCEYRELMEGLYNLVKEQRGG